MTFFLDGKAEDLAYLNTRNHPRGAHYRSLIEELWQEFEPIADANFRTEAMDHFYERMWEMYLAVMLQRRGYEVQSMGGRGPDFHVSGGATSCYIEATAPGLGDGADAVPEMVDRIVAQVPEDQIILRLTGALAAKREQYNRAVAREELDQALPFIVAINGVRIRLQGVNGTLPPVVRAFLGFGPLCAEWGRESKKIERSYFQRREAVEKASGVAIPTNGLVAEDYPMVSGVLFSWAGLTTYPGEYGSEFIFVRNSQAVNPLPDGFFPFGQEYWVEGNQLFRREWGGVE